MRISNISRQNFGMLLTPNTEEMNNKIDQLDDSTLHKLNDLKEQLNDTKYYHLKVDENLNFEIVCDIDTPWGEEKRILDYNRRNGNRMDMYWQTEYQGSLTRTEDTYSYDKKDYIKCIAAKNDKKYSTLDDTQSMCWIIERMDHVAEVEERHQQERNRLKANLFA